MTARFGLLNAQGFATRPGPSPNGPNLRDESAYGLTLGFPVNNALDYLKVLVPLLGGGLVGAFINEWFGRSGARVQVIPLIIRVGRSVKADMKGFTLARITGPDSPPEPVALLHEYQFTLRKTVRLDDKEFAKF